MFTGRLAIAVLLAGVFSASVAMAAMGEVGSPVKASNAPEGKEGKKSTTKKEEPADEPVATAEESKPLLVIRFNQKHVYFDRALRQAVESVERTKAGASYTVVSYVPSGKSGGSGQNERRTEDAVENLNEVVGGLAQQGVETSRIHYSSQTDDKLDSQEIHIFVD
jgi:hypothetical protein